MPNKEHDPWKDMKLAGESSHQQKEGGIGTFILISIIVTLAGFGLGIILYLDFVSGGTSGGLYWRLTEIDPSHEALVVGLICAAVAWASTAAYWFKSKKKK